MLFFVQISNFFSKFEIDIYKKINEKSYEFVFLSLIFIQD